MALRKNKEKKTSRKANGHYSTKENNEKLSIKKASKIESELEPDIRQVVLQAKEKDVSSWLKVIPPTMNMDLLSTKPNLETLLVYDIISNWKECSVLVHVGKNST